MLNCAILKLLMQVSLVAKKKRNKYKKKYEERVAVINGQ